MQMNIVCKGSGSMFIWCLFLLFVVGFLLGFLFCALLFVFLGGLVFLCIFFF